MKVKICYSHKINLRLTLVYFLSSSLRLNSQFHEIMTINTLLFYLGVLQLTTKEVERQIRKKTTKTVLDTKQIFCFLLIILSVYGCFCFSFQTESVYLSNHYIYII